jgi:spermidine synthase
VVLLIAGIAVFAPAALLSAVPPMVVKLRLATLAETGTVVGRVSAVGTVGAIGGTFLAGFVLVAQLRVTTVLLSLAALLAIVGAWLTWRLRRRPRDIAVPVVLALLGATLSLTAPQRCEAETAYHCATVWTDGNRPTGRVLELDNLRHSYVDLAEPRWVEFEYLRAIAAAVDVFRPSGASLRALHVGGGGYTLPRYLEATRPGSSSHVLEIDPGVTRLAQRRLDLVLGGGITAASQDGRVGLRREPSGSRDLVVGDAFGGVAVPWHLTTRESVREVARVVGEQGLYAVNVIDYQPLAFARSEVATIAAEFAHVAVVATPETLARAGGGNVVVLASQSPLPVEALRERLRSQVPSWDLLVGADAVRGFVAGAEVLTDDFAPVDQLLTPNPPPVAAG